MEDRIAVLISTKNRATEVCLLLQSLRTQGVQNFDVFLLEDFSNVPLQNFHFYHCLTTTMKMENHKIYYGHSSIPLGVSKCRQKIVDWALKTNDYKYLLRVDDDCILKEDFIERLLKVIEKGYDLASGVTPGMVQPLFKRDSKHLKGIVNRVILDKEGNYVLNNDDCGMPYTNSVILPAHHFRSSALYKSEIHKKVNYLPTRLTKHGFREEQIFSYKLLMNGYKIGVDTGAIAWHLMTPTGGERFPDSQNLVKFNQQILEEFTKENKEKLNELFPQEPLPTKQELMKEVNLAGLR